MYLVPQIWMLNWYRVFTMLCRIILYILWFLTQILSKQLNEIWLNFDTLLNLINCTSYQNFIWFYSVVRLVSRVKHPGMGPVGMILPIIVYTPFSILCDGRPILVTGLFQIERKIESVREKSKKSCPFLYGDSLYENMDKTSLTYDSMGWKDREKHWCKRVIESKKKIIPRVLELWLHIILIVIVVFYVLASQKLFLLELCVAREMVEPFSE